MAERNGKVTRADREAREFPDNLRPTERRVYDLLSDGERHTKWEIARVIDPELPSPPGVRVHICNLRAQLPPQRLIVCEVVNTIVHYRMVVPLYSLHLLTSKAV